MVFEDDENDCEQSERDNRLGNLSELARNEFVTATFKASLAGDAIRVLQGMGNNLS